MRQVRTVIGVAIAVATLLGASACGDDTAPDAAADETTAAPSSSDSSTPPVDGTPCESVWVEGADLPKGYDGCVADGALVAPKWLECSSGQRIVLYDDHYWALPGHLIGFAPDGLSNDKKYQRVLYSCRA